jgi:Cys-tRNA(Pro)/Cys-tRNA(Cys) deacylase
VSGAPGKTNAARALDALGIRYQLRAYEVDPDDLSAETVAAKVGLPAEQVWKTLVVRGEASGVFMVLLPGDAELDPRALARAVGDKRVDVVPLKEVTPLTGYVRGGVTALGGKKAWRMVADETLELYDEVSVSAGVRGLQIILAPADYLRATQAQLAPIARDKLRG